MKKTFLLLLSILAAFCAQAQVSTEGLKSEKLTSGQVYYMVSVHGYFITYKGNQIIATTSPTKNPEWKAMRDDDGTFSFRSGSTYFIGDPEGKGFIVGNSPQYWTIESGFTPDTYSFHGDIVTEFFGDLIPDNDYFCCNASGTVFGWPLNANSEFNDRDFFFFTTLPDQLKGGGGEGGDENDLVEVPENNIESDFMTNWGNNMQDAKVLTYAPMDKTQVYMQEWAAYRKGVTSYNDVIYTDDVVEKFVGNKIKNLWFILPPNGATLEFYIKDPYVEDPSKSVLWSKSFDYTNTVSKIMKQKNGLIKHMDSGYDYGNDLNMELKAEGDEYYIHDEIIAIPCDYEITADHMNLQIGYAITYAGNYSDHYKNGRDPKGGLTDGYWFSTSYLMPTSRTSLAYVSGDSDPDWHNGRFEDYTRYTEPFKPEYKWTDYATLFCFVETEGAGGFPHSDIHFEEVKVSRCFTGDSRVPLNATFTNYGVDPIMTARFNVTIGDKVQTIRFRDGIKFLEVGSLADNIEAPETPVRTPMNISVSHINGKEVSLNTNINGSIVAIDEDDNVQRMPVVEENTGTWCGWCPRGILGMEKLRQRYGEDIALIAIHTGADQKANGMMDELLGTFGAGGAPTCLVNRKLVCDPYTGSSGKLFGIAQETDGMMNLVTEATMKFDRVVRSSDKKRIGVRTNVNFAINCAESPYTLTYVVTEDDLKYATQANYYVTQTTAAEREQYRQSAPDLYELTQKPNPWRPVYNDVMEYCAAPMGINGSLDGTIEKGTPKVHQYTITIPSYTNGTSLVTNLDNCRLIALLLDKESLEVVNATQIRLEDVPVDDSDALLEGIDTVLRPNDAEGQNLQGTTFDLQGRVASATSKGLLIKNGTKILK